MEITRVKSKTVTDNSFILKPGYHMNYGKKRIEKAIYNEFPFDSLGNVSASVFTGGIFKRVFVDDPKYGYPYISAQHMMNSNPLDVAKIISKKYTPRQEEMSLKESQILVSCAGTVGNVKLITKDLEGVIGSQDIIRVNPDDTKLPYGYLYAYLASKTAYNYMQSYIYGSVVPRIEPNTLSRLPIPILSEEKQQQIHQLIVEASELIVEANRLLNEAVCFFDFLKTDYITGKAINKNVSIKKLNNSKKRFDANYNIISSEVDRVIDNQRKDIISILELSENIFIGPRTKRNYVENGVPFLSTSEMQKLNPTKTEKSINHTVANDFAVKEGWLLTTRSGTLGDTIYALPCLNGYAVSEDAIRIVLKKDALLSNKYLFAFLKSNLGKSSLLSGSYGSVILHLNEEYIGDIKVPILEQNEIQRIEEKIDIYVQNINNAILKENQAIALIENEIDLWQVS